MVAISFMHGNLPVDGEFKELLRWIVEKEVLKHRSPPAVRVQIYGQHDGVACNELTNDCAP